MIDSPNTAPTIVAIATLVTSLSTIGAQIFSRYRASKEISDATKTINQHSTDTTNEVKSAITNAADTGVFKAQNGGP